MSDTHDEAAFNAEDEAELERYLAGESALSTLYRAGSQALPPAHLDAAVMKAARDAEGPRRWWQAPLELLTGLVARVMRPRPIVGRPVTERSGRFSGAPFGARWRAPVVVASVVVVVSVVLLLEPEVDLFEEGLAPTSTSTAPKRSSPKSGKIEAPATIEALEAAPSTELPATEAPRLGDSLTEATPATQEPSAAADVPVSALPSKALDPQSERGASGVPARTQAAPVPDALTSSAAATLGAADDAVTSEGGQRAALSPSVAPAPPPAGQDASGFGNSTSSAPAGDGTVELGQIAQQLFREADAKRKRIERKRKYVAEERSRLAPLVARATPQRADSADVPGATAPPADAGALQTPPAAPAAPAAQGARLSPALELALARIRTLLQEGRLADAREALTRFERLAPDATVPDDIRAALPVE